MQKQHGMLIFGTELIKLNYFINIYQTLYTRKAYTLMKSDWCTKRRDIELYGTRKPHAYLAEITYVSLHFF